MEAIAVKRSRDRLVCHLGPVNSLRIIIGEVGVVTGGRAPQKAVREGRGAPGRANIFRINGVLSKHRTFPELLPQVIRPLGGLAGSRRSSV